MNACLYIDNKAEFLLTFQSCLIKGEYNECHGQPQCTYLLWKVESCFSVWHYSSIGVCRFH